MLTIVSTDYRYNSTLTVYEQAAILCNEINPVNLCFIFRSVHGKVISYIYVGSDTNQGWI